MTIGLLTNRGGRNHRARAAGSSRSGGSAAEVKRGSVVMSSLITRVALAAWLVTAPLSSIGKGTSPFRGRACRFPGHTVSPLTMNSAFGKAVTDPL